MICRPKNGLTITDDCSNVFLFYQCINEMVFDYSPDTYKAKTLNVHSICRELWETYDMLCKAGIEEKYFQKYTTIIIDELIDCMKDDIPAREILGGRYQRIIKDLEESKSNKKTFKSTIRNLIGYFSNRRYYNFVKENLIKNICAEKNQKIIIKLSGTWVTELLNLGYSKQHIYNVVTDFFSNKCIDNKVIISQFFELFDFERKKWEFVIPIDERIMTYLGNLSKLSEINQISMVKMEIKELSELIQHKEYKSLTWFFNEIQLLSRLYNVKLVRCTCKSLDPYAGMKYLQGYLKFLTNIIVIVDNETKQVYSTCVCLNYNKMNIKIKAAMHRRNRVYAQSYLPHILGLLRNMNLSNETYKILMNVFGYHGDAITSGIDSKYTLTMLWTALETLFANDNHNKNKGESVKVALVEILQRTYITKCLKYLHKDFVANVKATNKDLINYFDLESFPQFVEILFDEKEKDKENKLKKTLENNPLLRTRIFSLIDNLKNGESIEKFLIEHRKKLLQQIDRIYRNRNFLIHAGQDSWYIDEIVECLHNYLDFVINYIIVKMQSGEGIMDVYDVIEEARIDNELHHDILKKNKELDSRATKNYKKLLFGPSDNVLHYYTDHDV